MEKFVLINDLCCFRTRKARRQDPIDNGGQREGASVEPAQIR